MKKSLLIVSLIAAFALAACNKPAEQPAPETTDNSATTEAPADSSQNSAAPDEDQAAPVESTEMPEAPDTEKNEESESK
jgi:hypothetical protein